MAIVKSRIETQGRDIRLLLDPDYNPEGYEDRYVVFRDELKDSGLLTKDLDAIKERLNDIILASGLDMEISRELITNYVDGNIWDFNEPYTAEFDGGTF
jgi:hypothetical protein